MKEARTMFRPLSYFLYLTPKAFQNSNKPNHLPDSKKAVKRVKKPIRTGFSRLMMEIYTTTSDWRIADSRKQALSIGGKLTDEQTASVLNIMLRGGEETDETLMQLIDRNGGDVLTYLAGQGAINDTQVQSAYGRDGRMTPEAKNDLADLVTQNIFKGGADNIKRVWNEYMPVAAQKALLQAMAGDLRLPKKARLIEYVRNAIMAVGEIKNNPFTKEAKTAEEYRNGLDMDARQADMLRRPIKERYNELELYIAVDILLTRKQNAIKAIFWDYQRLFLEKGADLFEAPKEYTPEEAIEKVFGIKLNKTDNNEQRNDTGGSHEVGTSETGETTGNGELGRGERQTEGEPGAAAGQPGAAEQAGEQAAVGSESAQQPKEEAEGGTGTAPQPVGGATAQDTAQGTPQKAAHIVVPADQFNIDELDFENNYIVVHQTGSHNIQSIQTYGLRTGPGLAGTAVFANRETIQSILDAQRAGHGHEQSDSLVIMSFPKAQFKNVRSLDDISYQLDDITTVPPEYIERVVVTERASEEEVGKPKLLDAIKAIAERGKEYAQKVYSRVFFDVAETPQFMKDLGLTGDKFTIKYGAISRHFGKDNQHDLPQGVWEKLPEAITKPFAITRYSDKANGYRLYTAIKVGESYVVVGVDVKNAGRELEVNSISTIFAKEGQITSKEEVIYRSKEITPDQTALLEKPNSSQYQSERELSSDKDTKNFETNKEKIAIGGKTIDKDKGIRSIKRSFSKEGAAFGHRVETVDLGSLTDHATVRMTKEEFSESQKLFALRNANVIDAAELGKRQRELEAKIRDRVSRELDEGDVSSIVSLNGESVEIEGGKNEVSAESGESEEKKVEGKSQGEEETTVQTKQEAPKQGQVKKIDALVKDVVKKNAAVNKIWNRWLKDNSGGQPDYGDTREELEEAKYNLKQALRDAPEEVLERLKQHDDNFVRQLAVDELERRGKMTGIAKEFEEGMKSQGEVSKPHKSGPLNADVYTSKEVNRTQLQGVFHDPEGYGVATDIHIMIWDKGLYDEGKKGKIVATHKVKPYLRSKGAEKGGVIEGSYPAWRNVRQNYVLDKRAAVDYGRLLDFLAGAEGRMKERWRAAKERGEKVGTFEKYKEEAEVMLRMSDGSYKLFGFDLLKRFAEGAEHLGATEVGYGFESYPLMCETERGGVLVMPKYMEGEKSGDRWYYDMGEGAKQQRAEGSAKAPSARERRLFDGLVEVMRKAGMRVNTDWEKGQRVLEMARRLGIAVNDMRRNKKSTSKTAVPGEETPFKAAVVSEIDAAKIAKNLDSLIKKTQNLSNEQKKHFISEVAKVLGAKKYGSNSEYVTFETKNGEVTLRLADHNAKVSNFDYSGRENGISIVISRKPNTGIENDGNAHIVEYFYPDKALKKADNSPYSEIVRSIQQMLYSGEYKDTTGLAQRQEVNAEQVRMHRVFHGSGADFDAFDHSHMGEGEGAQAYGWGSYVTEVEGVGMEYAQIKKNTVDYVGGRRRDEDKDSPFNVALNAIYNGLRRNDDFDSAKERLLREYETLAENTEKAFERTNNQIYKEEAEFYRSVAEHVRGFERKDFEIEVPSKYLYTVEIPEDNGGNYLKWEGNLGTEEAKRLREALEKEVLARDEEGAYSGNEKELRSELEKAVREGVTGNGVYGTVSDYLGGAKEASEWLHSIGYAGIRYPVGAMSGGNKEGKSNYVIFDEGDLEITDKVKFFRTESGEAYGFTMGGKIYLDPRIATAETPIHEYTHLWAAALRQANPKAWEQLKSELEKDKDLMAYVQRLYPELEGDELMDEVFAHFSGRRGAERLRAEQVRMEGETRSLVGKAKVIAMFETLRDALRRFWNTARDLFAGRTRGIGKMSAEDFADMALADLVGGFKPDRGDRVDRSDRERDDGIQYEKVGGDENDNRAVTIIGAEKEHGFANFGEARKWAKKNIVGEYNNPEIGGVNISGTAIDKYLSEKAVSKSDNKDVHLSALKVMPSIIENSIVGEVHNDREGDSNIRDIVRLYGAIDIDGKTYRVKTTVKRYNDDAVKTKAYSYEVTEIELLEGFSGTPHTQSADFVPTSNNSISAAKLLKNIEKSYDKGKKLLDESGSELEDSDVRFRGEEEPVFYSNARWAVENIKQERATPEQWVKMIEKQGGMKAGEDKWLGLSEWLKGSDAKTLTKGEVLDYIRANEIQVEEVEYGDYADDADLELLKQEYDQWLHDEGYDYAQERLIERFGDDATIAFTDVGGELEIADSEAAAALLGKEMPINSTRLEYTTEGLDNKREIVLTVPTIEPWNEHDEVHFGEAGGGRAVAWVRFGETTDADGKRVLVIDEIQSNRHQEGREKGYKSAELQKKIARMDELNFKMGTSEGISNEEYEELMQLRSEGIGQQSREKSQAVPDAPFEKNWHEVAMKRMLRFAAENGYDKVAWTKGEQQAERYDLSKEIREIKIRKDGRTTPEGEALYEVYTYDNNTDGEIAGASGMFNATRLKETFGKELAERLENVAKESQSNGAWDNWGSINGDGLRIGGEGMKGFYDHILPRFMDKYGKRWGVKTGEVELPNIGENGLTMWSVDVTDDMRESVMRGQPLFRLREDEAPTKTGTGYKVFVLKDGKLYPPMVANPNGEATPVGVWLDADAAPVVGESKTGRPQVKAGGKGTQGGSGQLAYRPGWHLGTIPYALQFNRKNPETGEKDLFPANFVWAEVDYADDIDYQEEARAEGVNASGKYQHSLAGLKRVPVNGSYMYRTNPDPNTDPWIITGAMRVRRILKPSEVDEMVRAAGREPQKRQEGAITDAQIDELNDKINSRLREGGEEANAGEWYDRNSVERIGEFAGYTPVQVERMRERQEESARRQFRETAEKLHLGDRITFVDTIDEIEGMDERTREARRRKKGWYDPRTGKIVIILDNHRSMDDVMKSILHEGVAHHGLRQMFGKHFDRFLENVYETVSPEIRERIDEMAKKHGWDFREATEEYLAMLAEDTEFEKPENQSWWKQVKAWFIDLLHKIGFKLHDAYDTITDNELRYILWRSYKNLVNPGRYNSVVEEAKDIAKQYELKVGEYAEDAAEYAQRDAEYMEAVESGDMEKAQRIVNEAARKAGYTVEAYHGTTNGRFTVFDNAKGKSLSAVPYNNLHAFTSSKNVADSYRMDTSSRKPKTGEKFGATTQEVQHTSRINIQKATKKDLGLYAKGKMSEDEMRGKYGTIEEYGIVDPSGQWRYYPTEAEAEARLKEYAEGEYSEGQENMHVFLDLGDKYEYDAHGGTYRDAIDGIAEENPNMASVGRDDEGNWRGRLEEDLDGYDSIVIRNVEDSGSGYKGEESDVYFVKDPNRIKSADPVTYDDAGNVIPLSERFNKRNGDIRYEKGGKRERTTAEKEVDKITHEENGVLYHKAMEMQADFIARTGTMPLEMGVFTDKHFVIVNNVSEGNITAVRAFDIEKQQKETTDAVKEIYRRYTDAGLSEDSRRVIEEFGRIYGNGARNNLSRELGQMADRGVHAVGERQQSDRGADNALDSGTHVADDGGVRFRGEDGEDLRFRLREDEEPTKTGTGHKVFVLKDGKLNPPMVADPGWESTPVKRVHYEETGYGEWGLCMLRVNLVS
ncbi:MAG: hypothetical protein IJK84_08260 [Bacteroidales bacterium]|nr:hypothetical protein [Bacteroidales bacterium]